MFAIFSIDRHWFTKVYKFSPFPSYKVTVPLIVLMRKLSVISSSILFGLRICLGGFIGKGSSRIFVIPLSVGLTVAVAPACRSVDNSNSVFVELEDFTEEVD